MRKISIQTIEETEFHAIAKARGDVNAILRQCGYTPVVFGSTSPIGIWRVLMRHYDIASIKWKIRKGDQVFLQFPWIHNNKKQFYDNLFSREARVDCIVHDIDSFRYGSDNKKYADELEQLNRCDNIIAHTEAMKSYLAERGVDARKIKTINLFPYLTDDPIHTHDNGEVNTVIFAGNMEKSPFVDGLREIATPGLRFNIYGRLVGELRQSEHVKYKGMFEPDHPGEIEGNWGLVWDGPRLDTCTGEYGLYLQYNSSHKFSLYLALGIPVIVWEQSSLKNFITERNLGIAIGSLQELQSRLSALSKEEIKAMQKNARDFAPKLRSGDILRDLLQ